MDIIHLHGRNSLDPALYLLDSLGFLKPRGWYEHGQIFKSWHVNSTIEIPVSRHEKKENPPFVRLIGKIYI